MMTSAEATAKAAGIKAPRTNRGQRTLRKLLDAAAIEFGEHGFHDTSISGITRRAGTALGSFYTYFDSKDAIFRALVADMSGRVRDHVGPAIQAAPDALAKEGAALAAFLAFAREHQEIYRINLSIRPVSAPIMNQLRAVSLNGWAKVPTTATCAAISAR
jgi:AcrR family transcriptional regulator